MSALRWKFHEMRWSHNSNMAYAQSRIELAAYHVRASNRYAERSSFDDAELSRWLGGLHASAGWTATTEAIKRVTKCGCPRRLWRQAVQDAIPEDTE